MVINGSGGVTGPFFTTSAVGTVKLASIDGGSGSILGKGNDLFGKWIVIIKNLIFIIMI